MSAQKPTGGRILVDNLLLHGADTIFCVPGESYLAALDALHDVRDRIKLVTCRQEGGAGFMAEAYGKLTGRPGIAFVTRAPGATNASIAVQVAREDATPMILLVGQVPRGHSGRGVFQEIDYTAVFGGLAKWAAQVETPERIPEYMLRAFQVATSGRPGPVVLAFPEDVLEEEAAPQNYPRPYTPARPAAVREETARVARLLGAATRPLIIVGSGIWTDDARRHLHDIARAFNVPVGTAFRRKDLFDNTHPAYAGDVGLAINPALEKMVIEADLLIMIGAVLTDTVAGGYTRINAPRPRQTLVHVDTAPDAISMVCQADVAICSEPESFLAGLLAAAPAVAPRGDWVRQARASYDAFSRPTANTPLDLAQVIAHVSDTLPDEGIVTNGAGNYTIWLHRFYQHRRAHTLLAPGNGSMGYGVPAAVAAQVVHRGRRVVSFSGDGCFMMNGQELATAASLNLPVIFIVINNAKYGTIRAHQERAYPGRVVATDLGNPDFAVLASAYGMSGDVVETFAAFKTAFARALDHQGPSLIEIRHEYYVGPPR